MGILDSLLGSGSKKKKNTNTTAQKKKLNPMNDSEFKFKVKKTVQETIPYDTVYPNGIIETEPGRYSKSYKIQDTNFKTAEQKTQENMFLDYEALLNNIRPGMIGQLNIFNRSVDIGETKAKLLLKPKTDELNDFRDEFNDMLLDKISEGNNNLIKEKYFTMNIPAADIQVASNSFSQIDADINAKIDRINHLDTPPMTLDQRLELLYDLFNDNSLLTYKNKIHVIEKNDGIDLEKLNRVGLSTKDIIAPESFTFERDYFMIGNRYGRVFMLDNLPSFLNTDILSDLTNLSCNMIVSCTFRPVPADYASKLVAHQITNVNENIVRQQKKAAKNGYSGEILPAELQRAKEQAKALRDDMQSRNQKLFMVSILITIFADSKEELDENSMSLSSQAIGHLCDIKNMQYQQESAFNTCLPLGVWDIRADRVLTSEQSALFIPFNVQELTQENGIYYGLNAISRNLIVYDRLSAENANGMIFGTPGSGKSFIAKSEIVQTLLNTNDEICIIDPEGEYFPLAKAFGGQVIKISTGAQDHINPLDMDAFYGGEEDDPIAMKCDFLTSLCETIVGHGYLDPIMVTEIHRCGRRIYKAYWEQMEDQFQQGNVTIDRTKMPTLVEFYTELANSKTPQGQHIAACLEPYCIGNYDVFAHQTDVDIDARFIVYDISSVSKQSPQMKEFALQVCVDNIWNRIMTNKKLNRRTWFYIDEFHVLMKSESSARYLEQVYRRARKYKGVPTGITQNVNDLLNNDVSDLPAVILNTCKFLLIMNQSQADRAAVAKAYNVSDQLLEYISDAPKGNGLLYNGKTVVPYVNEFPRDTKLYKIMSTNPNEKPEKQDADVNDGMTW